MSVLPKQEPENKTAFFKTLGCIVCRKQLANVHEGAQNHPEGGVVCTTRGNYGSTAFDPTVSPHYLEFNVCDRCLQQAAAHGLVALGYPSVPLIRWSPGLEDRHP